MKVQVGDKVVAIHSAGGFYQVGAVGFVAEELGGASWVDFRHGQYLTFPRGSGRGPTTRSVPNFDLTVIANGCGPECYDT